MNVILTSKDASARVRRWQRGGTVTGVIVGLIVGLTVAVWVAMTILKTPLPFVDKISKQTQPAGELGDPNKTMPGGARERRERISDDEPKVPGSVPATPPPPAAAKSAKAEMAPALAVPASSPATEKSRLEKSPASTNAASQASTPAPATNPTNTVTPATSAATAASTPATAPPAAPSTTAAPQPEGFTYYLQAGAFREINDAEATKAKLALMGVAATIAERKSELGTLYRVRVGPFSEIEAMNRARLRLSDNGVDAAVVKVPK
jgi:cell division protein FtsN